MRRNSKLSPIAASAELMPPDDATPLDLVAIFGRSAPVEVDLGCGDGSFLAALAEQNPGSNFLGIERLIGRVRGACRRIAQRDLRNARILHADILHTVRKLLPPASVDVVHIMFPDPWPKRRHQRHRIVSEDFLHAITTILREGGRLRIATDHADYFKEISHQLIAIPNLVAISADEISPLPTTTFESRFRSDGEKIYRRVLRKLSGRHKTVALL